MIGNHKYIESNEKGIWICSKNDSHIFNEPSNDLFCPKSKSYEVVLMEYSIIKK